MALTDAEKKAATAKLVAIVNQHPDTGITTGDLSKQVPNLTAPQIRILLKASPDVKEQGAIKGKSGGSNPAHGWKPVQHGLEPPWKRK
jgi:hypothetical protein